MRGLTSEWDGTSWTSIQATGAAPSGEAMAFDEARGVTVLWHGQTSTPETWEYTVFGGAPATWSVFGQGCAGPVGTPNLASVTGSLPRLGSTFQVRLGNLPATPFNLPFGVVGFDATSWNSQPLPVSLDPFGFTGCQAWIDPAIGVTLTNTLGIASWNIAVPLDLDLIGTDFFLQGCVLVPGWNSGGIVFSNAGHGVIGTP